MEDILPTCACQLFVGLVFVRCDNGYFFNIRFPTCGINITDLAYPKHVTAMSPVPRRNHKVGPFLDACLFVQGLVTVNDNAIIIAGNWITINRMYWWLVYAIYNI